MNTAKQPSAYKANNQPGQTAWQQHSAQNTAAYQNMQTATPHQPGQAAGERQPMGTTGSLQPAQTAVLHQPAQTAGTYQPAAAAGFQQLPPTAGYLPSGQQLQYTQAQGFYPAPAGQPMQLDDLAAIRSTVQAIAVQVDGSLQWPFSAAAAAGDDLQVAAASITKRPISQSQSFSIYAALRI